LILLPVFDVAKALISNDSVIKHFSVVFPETQNIQGLGCPKLSQVFPPGRRLPLQQDMMHNNGGISEKWSREIERKRFDSWHKKFPGNSKPFCALKNWVSTWPTFEGILDDCSQNLNLV
jgi:hypothetical protein